MASKKDVAAILALLSAAYPRFTLTENTVATYYLFLKDLGSNDLQIAAKRCASTQEFFPTVYELRQAVAETMREIQRLPGTYEAWDEVVHFPKDGFFSRVVEEKLEGNKTQLVIEKCPVIWSHPLVEKVAHQMGWPAFPDLENLGVDRAHFFRAYEYALDAALRDCVQLPEVKDYVDRSRVPEIQARIDQLVEKWKP